MIDVVDDDRRRRTGDVAELERHALVGVVLLLRPDPRIPVADQVLGQVDHARGAESRAGQPGGPSSGSGLPVSASSATRKKPGVAMYTTPLPLISEYATPFAVRGAHRVLRAVRLGLDPIPEQLAVRRIDRHHVAPRPGHAQQLASNVTWSGAGRHRADDVDWAELPGFLQSFEVRRRDLIERRVSGVADVTAEGPPLSVLRAAPGRLRGGDGQGHGAQKADGNNRNH